MRWINKQQKKNSQYSSVNCNLDHILSLLNCWMDWCRVEFYKKFYSVFDDQYAAMDVLLNGKEFFSFQVLTHLWNISLSIHIIKSQSLLIVQWKLIDMSITSLNTIWSICASDLSWKFWSKLVLAELLVLKYLVILYWNGNHLMRPFAEFSLWNILACFTIFFF